MPLVTSEGTGHDFLFATKTETSPRLVKADILDEDGNLGGTTMETDGEQDLHLFLNSIC